jgi:hypothetical protein
MPNVRQWTDHIVRGLYVSLAVFAAGNAVWCYGHHQQFGVHVSVAGLVLALVWLGTDILIEREHRHDRHDDNARKPRRGLHIER